MRSLINKIRVFLSEFDPHQPVEIIEGKGIGADTFIGMLKSGVIANREALLRDFEHLNASEDVRREVLEFYDNLELKSIDVSAINEIFQRKNK